MDTYEECASVEAVVVAVADEVDVLEVAGWEEDVEGYGWVDEDDVRVYPPIPTLAYSDLGMAWNQLGRNLH